MPSQTHRNIRASEGPEGKIYQIKRNLLAQNELAFCYVFFINTHFEKENSSKRVNTALANLEPEVLTVRNKEQMSLSCC